MDAEMLLRAVDYVQRGKKSCEDAAENLLNHEPALSYYRGKAKAFSEVLAFLELIDKMKVRIKKLNDNAVLPTKAHATDAGFDLYCTSREVNWEKRQLVCHTGLAFEIPEGHVGLIFPRSSVSNKPLMMANSVGVVDSCYRGEVTAKFNITDTRQSAFSHYQEGDRIAQMIIIPYPEIEFEETDSLSESDRGTGGYGSTGR